MSSFAKGSGADVVESKPIAGENISQFSSSLLKCRDNSHVDKNRRSTA
jgi:hypothetical protein